MTIYKCDGTPYQVTGNLSQFDPESPDIDLMQELDAEQIQFGGSPIFYFEIFIQFQTVDLLYREDRGKIWSSVPSQLYGTYDPQASQNFQNMFGIDSPDELQITFNYRAILKVLGRPPKLGARIYTPHKRENWVIVQRNLKDFQLWSEFHLELQLQRFQESVTTGEGLVTQKQPDFSIDNNLNFINPVI
jgi:hypothetical protein